MNCRSINPIIYWLQRIRQGQKETRSTFEYGEKFYCKCAKGLPIRLPSKIAVSP